MQLATNRPTSQPQRPKRSVPLTVEEVEKLNEFLKDKTWFEAGMELGIERGTLDRVVRVGSGAEKTITKIRAKLG